MDKPVVVTRGDRQYIGFEMVVTRVVRLNPGEEPEAAMSRYWDTDESGTDFLDEALQDVRWLNEDMFNWLGDPEKMRIHCNGDDDEED